LVEELLQPSKGGSGDELQTPGVAQVLLISESLSLDVRVRACARGHGRAHTYTHAHSQQGTSTTEQKKQQNTLLYGNPSEKRKVLSRTHRLTPTNRHST
jgi:hypothetical protein